MMLAAARSSTAPATLAPSGEVGIGGIAVGTALGSLLFWGALAGVGALAASSRRVRHPEDPGAGAVTLWVPAERN
jgi:hypothetical protein